MSLLSIGELVRKQDPERYLCCLFAPENRRQDLFTLLAFNHELVNSVARASEEMVGLIRLQWWRDVLAGFASGRVPEQEIAAALAGVVLRHGISVNRLEGLIDAREQDLDDTGPKTQDDLVAYCQGTSAGLSDLMLDVLGVDHEVSRAAARDAAIGFALSGLLRSSAHLAAGGRAMVPDEVLDRAGLSASDWRRGKGAPVRAAAGEVAAMARTHIANARARSGEIDRASLPVLLQATLASWHLDRLEAKGNDPFHPVLANRLALAPLRLALTAYRGRY